MSQRVRRIFLLATLAYIPLLASAPGRVPGDTKLYLYLDPGRLISDSIWSWDARQLGGWVPHQNVGYLWPSGPFYAVFDWLGVPDWITHRLWTGSLLLLAGLGVLWLAFLGDRRDLRAPAVFGAVAMAVVLVISGFWSAPAHGDLADGFDAAVHDRLMTANLVRSFAWTICGVAATWVLARVWTSRTEDAP